MSKIYQIASAVISNTDEEHIFLTDSMDCNGGCIILKKYKIKN